MRANPNCDFGGATEAAGPCSTNAEVRVLPTGGASNAIVCANHWRHELAYRRERNRGLEDFAKFDLPAWENLKVYAPLGVYTVGFVGCRVGALGIMSKWERVVEAPNPEGAVLALYDTHEHIVAMRVEETPGAKPGEAVQVGYL